MTIQIKKMICFAIIVFAFMANAQKVKHNDAIYSGIPWYDNNNNVVNAHGACIVEDGGRYYLFGEWKSDSTNAFPGFSCYSSKDLVSWKFERVVLPRQKEGILGPNRVGERVKVMKCPSTGEYVMYMHADDLGYKDPYIGYATCKTIDGEYKLQGPILYNGEPIRRWDMGTFQDTDGKGYLLIHHGSIYELSADYKSIKRSVISHAKGGESPAIFKHRGIYYWLSSNLTGWERNDNMYLTATSLEGPWTFRGIFAPKGTLTWNSQSTFVFPIVNKKDTTFMFMGDRWSYPLQGSAATYVWQPITIEGDSISLPNFKQSWTLNPLTGKLTMAEIKGQVIENNDKGVSFSGDWQAETQDSRSNQKGASFTVAFTGTQIGLYGTARPDGGYAQVVVKDKKGKIVISTAIDMYCQYPETSLKFLSPKLKYGTYTMSVSVLGRHWYWVEKSGRKSGSAGDYVSINKVVVKE